METDNKDNLLNIKIREFKRSKINDKPIKIMESSKVFEIIENYINNEEFKIYSSILWMNIKLEEDTDDFIIYFTSSWLFCVVKGVNLVDNSMLDDILYSYLMKPIITCRKIPDITSTSPITIINDEKFFNINLN